jgi:hypothetical protein
MVTVFVHTPEGAYTLVCASALMAEITASRLRLDGALVRVV